MRIVHVHSRCTPSMGIPRAAPAVADESARAGHDVHYLHAFPEEDSGKKITCHRLRVVTFPHSAEMLHFSRASYRACRSLNPDIVHTHGEVPFGDVVTAQSCHKRAMAVGSRFEPGRTRFTFGIADAVRLRNERLLYKHGKCRRVIAVSDGVRKELQEEYDVPSEKITVIPNGVDLDRFSPLRIPVDRTSMRNELGIGAGAQVLLIVANEFRRKGVHLVIDALARLNDDNLRLVVAGSDDPSPYLAQAKQRGLESQVQFTRGRISVERLYAAADLFVMPTFYEAFSLATLEAASSGLPLLVTRVHGTSELIVDGNNGYFIERDADDIAAKIRLSLNDQKRLEQMKQHARKSAEPFSWQKIVPQVLSVYGSVLKERR